MLAAPEGGPAQGKAHMNQAVWWSVLDWQAGAMAVNVFAALKEDLQQGMGGEVVVSSEIMLQHLRMYLQQARAARMLQRMLLQ
jgi:hypothetical protein